MEAKWRNSQRGRKLLVDTDNFVYRKVKDYADGITADYKCVKCNSIKCPGQVLVNKVENKIEKVSKHDNHSTEIHKEQAKEVVQAFVQHAATNTMVVSRLFKACGCRHHSSFADILSTRLCLCCSKARLYHQTDK